MPYEASDPVEQFWSHVKKIKGGCWLWTAATFKNKPYGMFSVNRCKSRTTGCGTFKAHRYSWQLKYGKIPKGLKVCHKCDVELCVRPSHLFLGTNADNSRDMVEKNRQASFWKHGRATFSERDLRRALERLRAGHSIDWVSKRYSIGKRVLRRARSVL